jgi:choline dehydrogenase-like flavoprotein
LRTNAVVSRILIERGGTRACGVEVIDAESSRVEEVRARIVVLCASTIESLRILLNSKSSSHPNGIGASSGILGRYLMDHIAGNVWFYLPDVRDDGDAHDFLGSDSIMVPRYQNLNGKTEEYPRGFGLWGGIQRIDMPRALRRKPDVAFGFLCARSETLPHIENRVELDPIVCDAWGIPAPRIVCEWKENDLLIARAARRAAIEMIEAAGGVACELTDLVRMPPLLGGFMRGMQKEWVCSTPGLFVHEVGGARMGTDPETSVVDPSCRVWDADNVLVTDGACWPSCGWQNPTLTQMAVTARACDRAIESLKRLEL